MNYRQLEIGLDLKEKIKHLDSFISFIVGNRKRRQSVNCKHTGFKNDLITEIKIMVNGIEVSMPVFDREKSIELEEILFKKATKMRSVANNKFRKL